MSSYEINFLMCFDYSVIATFYAGELLKWASEFPAEFGASFSKHFSEETSHSSIGRRIQSGG